MPGVEGMTPRQKDKKATTGSSWQEPNHMLVKPN